MHIDGSFTYYAFVSAPLGSSNLHVIYCLVEESDTKYKGGFYLREMCILELIWGDPHQCTSSALPWTLFLSYSIKFRKF